MKRTVFRLFNLIKKGELGFLIKGISKRIYSKTQAFGLKRDLEIPFEVPDAKIDIAIRPFKLSDSSYFAEDLQNHGLEEKKIPSCYVAVNSEDKPCYRQWLIGASENEDIKNFWRCAFPVLETDEGLLESAFTVQAFRGNKIMPAAMARIAEKGIDKGIRWVITFVGVDNIPSLKGCQRSGFSPYILRTEKWLFFRRRIVFGPVPNAMRTTYLSQVGVSK